MQKGEDAQDRSDEPTECFFAPRAFRRCNLTCTYVGKLGNHWTAALGVAIDHASGLARGLA